jgi:RsiW-degrading membrane proteinase PrsW (M82 family)
MEIYDKKEKAPHILNASSNLLGLCFVVLTSLRFLKLPQRALIDKTDMIAIFLFMLSCVLSFLSIRGNIKKGGPLEWLADILFIGGILVVFATAVLIVFDVIV